MANTYSSWEYSQGPILYIDSSGFESIDENKNFVYFYLVTYGPVEYKRKVVTEEGQTFYEFKYSFGTDNSARKVLEKVTFSGKVQVTKTVTHSVTEDGFKNTIKKTFYIDTNINTNIKDNSEVVVNKNQLVDSTAWTFYNQGSFTLPSMGYSYLGWITVTRTGYNTYSDYYWSSYTSYEKRVVSSYLEVAWGIYVTVSEVVYTPVTHYYKVWYTYTVPYTYTNLYNSYCNINFKTIREKIGDFANISSVILRLKTKVALNKAPNVYIDTSTSATSSKTQLTCKSSSSIAAGSVMEYYLPMSYITSTFKDKNMYLIIEKGGANAANCYISEVYAYIETEVDVIPYINLLVQSYNKASDTWSTACKIPYLNYKEIESLRAGNLQATKNLFLPSNLPKSDANYRIQLDTNLVAKEIERLINFRIDVLSDQLIKPGSIEDKKLYVNNDSLEFENEVEVGSVDELKLNVLGFSNHSTTPYVGFLKKGANDIHAYLKDANFTPKEDYLPQNISKNIWHSYVSKTNGNWISNGTFAANTFNFGQVGVLQDEDTSIKDSLIEFNIPYNNLKPYSTYVLCFDAYVLDNSFTITTINTVNAADESKVTKTKLFIESNENTSKITVKKPEIVFYKPSYKLKSGTTTTLVNEFSLTKSNVPVEIEIVTKDIQPSDTAKLTIKIKRSAMKNILLKDMHVKCFDKDNIKYIDIMEPYNISSHAGRRHENCMTVYYDGFNLSHINPLLFKDMTYLRTELDKIRREYTLEPYPWSNWANTYDNNNNLITDDNGHPYGVQVNQPLRAVHFNDVKQCCQQTYEDLLALKPPVILNTTPTMFREDTGLILLNDEDPSQGYVLQHYQDKLGNIMEIDKYFPEWKQIINLINRN